MVISKTPFRMSFFGGGTDFSEYFEKYGGSVLSATFDKYCFVTVRDFPPFFDHKNQLTYSKIERFDSPDELSHPLVREALKYLHENGIQISYDADLPARTGIGSSSSFAVGLLNSIHTLRGKYTDKKQLATEAILLERVLCKEYGGIQDQIAAAYGGLNRIDFNKDGFQVSPISISEERLEKLNSNLLLFFSGQSRFSSEIAKEQTSRTAENTETLHKMKALVDEGEKILCSKSSLDDFGELLDYSWKMKTTLANNITNDEINAFYETALRNGALGGKLLGAGGGGFILLYVPEKYQSKVKTALEKYMYVPFRFENDGSRILYSKI